MKLQHVEICLLYSKHNFLKSHKTWVYGLEGSYMFINLYFQGILIFRLQILWLEIMGSILSSWDEYCTLHDIISKLSFIGAICYGWIHNIRSTTSAESAWMWGRGEEHRRQRSGATKIIVQNVTIITLLLL